MKLIRRNFSKTWSFDELNDIKFDKDEKYRRVYNKELEDNPNYSRPNVFIIGVKKDNPEETLLYDYETEKFYLVNEKGKSLSEGVKIRNVE